MGEAGEGVIEFVYLMNFLSTRQILHQLDFLVKWHFPSSPKGYKMPYVKTKVSEWLEKDILNWQASEGKKKKKAQYADHIGVSESTLNNWIYKGTRPELEQVLKIASKRGPGIYDAMDISRPNPLLQIVIDNWGILPDELQSRIAEQVQNASSRRAAKKNDFGVGKSKRE